jgi:hypothetical protein
MTRRTEKTLFSGPSSLSQVCDLYTHISWFFVYALSFYRYVDAVHHWDENGLHNLLNEPPHIRKVHGEMIQFVIEWLKDWKKDVN